MPFVSANAQHARADAAVIVRRLLRGPATLRSMAAEYACNEGTVAAIYRQRTTAAQRERARARKQSITKRGKPTGRRPWNYNLKGIHLSPATEFKPGQLRASAAQLWRPVGTITIRTSSRSGKPCRWIKVSDSGPHKQRWMLLARFKWEQRFGLLPAAHQVVHQDGDALNDDVGNLLCVPRKKSFEFISVIFPDVPEKRRRRATKARAERAAIERQLRHAKQSRPANLPASVKPLPPRDRAARNITTFIQQLQDVA